VISSDHLKLKPGETGQIKASVDTKGRSGFLDKHISIYSNDPVNPVLTLSLSLTIDPKL
jgi:hypothetical protein